MKHILLILAFAAALPAFGGCTSTKEFLMEKDEAKETRETIRAVRLIDSGMVVFSRAGGVYNRLDRRFEDRAAARRWVAADSVAYAVGERSETSGTLLAAGFLAFLIFIVIQQYHGDV